MNQQNAPQTGAQSPEAAPEGKHRNWGKLERPGTRRRLIHELARGEKTQRQLATEYNVVESSMTEFKQRHEAQIEEVARDISNEFAGLWIADKLNRLDEQQGLYEDTNLSARERETRLAVLRAAAEELGQIPNRTTIDLAQPVEVRIVGAEDV